MADGHARLGLLADTLNLNAYLPVLGQWYTETMKLVDPWPGRQYIKIWPQYVVPNTRAVTYATPVSDYYNNVLTREVTNALYGRETPKQALDKVTVEVQQQLDQALSSR